MTSRPPSGGFTGGIEQITRIPADRDLSTALYLPLTLPSRCRWKKKRGRARPRAKALAGGLGLPPVVRGRRKSTRALYEWGCLRQFLHLHTEAEGQRGRRRGG